MYLAFAATAFRTQLAYRGQVWAAIFGQLVQVFARIAVWISLIASGATVAGASLSDMVTYAVLSGTVLGAWDPSHMLYGIDRSLKSGDISSQLLRPVPYPAYLFFSELGNLLWRTIAVVVPVVAAAALVYGLQWPASVFHGLMFPAFWLLSFVMLFCFACLGGLLAFWLMTAFSIDWLMWACLSLLSGNFIPLWFFPDWIAGYLKLLPFAWIGFYPAAVYLGKTGVAETVWLFLGGAAWIGLFAVALAALWRAATTRIIVQGG